MNRATVTVAGTSVASRMRVVGASDRISDLIEKRARRDSPEQIRIRLVPTHTGTGLWGVMQSNGWNQNGQSSGGGSVVRTAS